MDRLNSINSFSKSQLEALIDQHIKITETETSISDFYNENNTYLKSKILVTFFNSYSLRTRASFVSAFLRLGGAHMEFSQHEKMIKQNSNIESVSDTFAFISQYCDCITVRCDSSNLYNDICRSATVPIISAGHGEIENPTTAINYLVSIKRNIGKLDNLNVLIIAKPPKRCVNSLVAGLSNWEKNHIDFYDPFLANYYSYESNLNNKKAKNNDNLNFLKYDLIFVDESVEDFNNDITPKLVIGTKEWETINKNAHFIHAKPIVGLLSNKVKELVSEQTKLESRFSSILKSIIFKSLIHV